MTMKRVVWKDSTPKVYKPIKYRKHLITGYKGGWVIDIEGDNNIYTSHYCAQNAIDKVLGSSGRINPSEKRKKYGIQIIGQKDGETA